MRLEYAAGSNLNGKEQFQNYSLLTIKRIHTCEKQKSIKEKKNLLLTYHYYHHANYRCANTREIAFQTSLKKSFVHAMMLAR